MKFVWGSARTFILNIVLCSKICGGFRRDLMRSVFLIVRPIFLCCFLVVKYPPKTLTI